MLACSKAFISLSAYASCSLFVAIVGQTMTTADLVSEPSLPPVPACMPASTKPFFEMEWPSCAIWRQGRLLYLVDDIFSDGLCAKLEVQLRIAPNAAKTKARIFISPSLERRLLAVNV